MTLNYIRGGTGTPLLLPHGLGNSLKNGDLIMDGVAAQREVIAVDLPGFGQSSALVGEISISSLVDAVTNFLTQNQLLGIDAVGNSMGARLVLELARRRGRGRRLPGSGWVLARLAGSLFLPVGSAIGSIIQPHPAHFTAPGGQSD